MLNRLKKIVIFIFIILPSICYSLPGESVYNLSSKLTDKYGNEINIKEFEGKVHIFSMVYTNCKTICPIIIANMKNLEKMIPLKYLDNVRFTLITLDPERDTIISLNRFFIEKKLNEKRWSLYKTSLEDTLKIALATGIKYKKDRNNDYIHSNLIVILDKNGVVRVHHQGLDKNFDNLIKIIIDSM